METYCGGEDLFALPLTEYPSIIQTQKEIKLADQLFSLYTDVLNFSEDMKSILWSEITVSIGDLNEKVEAFSTRCKKLPARLREYSAYKMLKVQIEDSQTILPMIQELTKESIQERHWQEIMHITSSEFDPFGPEFKLQSLLDINMPAHHEEIEEVTDGADKQLKIEKNLVEIEDIWKAKQFVFKEWKGRGIQVLLGVVAIMEELEEAQMNLQAMLTMRHVTPFRERAQALLQTLSESGECIEKWLKVQMLWCSLESVFTGGDIAKQMVPCRIYAKVYVNLYII
jgi:dynein heavy chain